MDGQNRHGGPVPHVSLPCRSLWAAPHRPAEPREFLARLSGEVRRLGDLGARLVEFHAEACVLDDRYARPDLWRQVAEILDREGLGATVHLPYAWTDLAALDRQVWEGSVRSVETALAATAPLAPRVAAVHPANHATQAVVQFAPPPARAALLEALAGRLVAALRRLAGGPGGGALALENLEGVPLAVFVRVLEEADVGACVDVGHAISNGDDPLQVLASVGRRLAGLHLHDAVPPDGAAGAGVGRAHLPLGRGRLDLEALVEALAERGFAGPVVLEVEEDEDGSAERVARVLGRRFGGATPPGAS